jgi:L-iditol 2-dehydrogenase
MKALVLESYKKLVYKTVPDPLPSESEVLIRVKACGICGSDVHGLDGSTGRRIPPLIMGHEAAGEIVQIGKNVQGWQTGDRVTFDSTIYRQDDWYTHRGMYNLSDGRMVVGVSPGNYRRDGAFAEYIAVPDHILHKIPDDVSFIQAALVEPAAVAMHAVSLTTLVKNDTAVVVGAGIIGLFIIQALRIAGCGRIIAVDIDEEKLSQATRLGATDAYKADNKLPLKIRQNIHDRGADLAFDAVGTGESFNTAVNCVRRGAKVTLVGNLSPYIEMPLQKIVTEQICLQGSCASCGEYPAVLTLIEHRKLNVNAVLSKEAPLSEGAEWFRRLYLKEKGLMKVVLIP